MQVILELFKQGEDFSSLQANRSNGGGFLFSLIEKGMFTTDDRAYHRQLYPNRVDSDTLSFSSKEESHMY